MAYSKEMKEYAKQLFFTPNIYGEHKYGWTAISGKIQEKSSINVVNEWLNKAWERVAD